MNQQEMAIEPATIMDLTNFRMGNLELRINQGDETATNNQRVCKYIYILIFWTSSKMRPANS
jgi:hypothetical protein